MIYFWYISLETWKYFKWRLWRKLYLEIKDFHVHLQVSQKGKKQKIALPTQQLTTLQVLLRCFCIPLDLFQDKNNTQNITRSLIQSSTPFLWLRHYTKYTTNFFFLSKLAPTTKQNQRCLYYKHQVIPTGYLKEYSTLAVRRKFNPEIWIVFLKASSRQFLSVPVLFVSCFLSGPT